MRRWWVAEGCAGESGPMARTRDLRAPWGQRPGPAVVYGVAVQDGFRRLRVCVCLRLCVCGVASV